ncbi:hypothetical protein LTR84_007243 [Exophiala bonariae]|uniref:Uncharacterized protein n=1 Tax=Exophiala bonariae TaxID=1690606 RepID=A0AAV9MYU6_9EURO|nr:hypothetical protein LTR84_007243 [Exophiala bonariae]
MSDIFTSIFTKATSILGLLTTCGAVYRLVDFLFFHFTVSRDPLAAYRSDFPSHDESDRPKTYALITGSSGGIGFGLAESLVRRGFGVILLSNDEAGLQSAKQRLVRQYPNCASSIELVHLDAVRASVEDIQNRIISNCIELKNLTVTILINNVGGVLLPSPLFRVFSEYDSKGIDDNIDLNARFMAHVTRAMLPTLSASSALSSSRRPNRSLILSMSSGARSGIPWQGIYSATKAFNAAFSMALAREFRATGVPIDCIAVVPGDVLTDSNYTGLGAWSPSAHQFGEMILNRVPAAVSRHRLWMSPYWLHAIQIAIMDWIPETILCGVLADKMVDKKLMFEKEAQKQK